MDLKLGGLLRTGMRHADQVHEGIAGVDLGRVSVRAQGVAMNDFAALRQFALGAGTHQRPHSMAAPQKFGG